MVNNIVVYPYIIVICLTLTAISPYFVWFSRKNFIGHLQLGFILTGYIIPGLLTNNINQFVDSVIIIYSYILILGTVSYIFGQFIGYKTKLSSMENLYISVNRSITRRKYIGRVVMFSSVAAILTMVFCFIYMGFIPIFAEDPLTAKFFRGVYKARYQNVAVFYRTAFQFIILLMPINFIIWFKDKSQILYFLIFILQIILLIMTLNRGVALAGLISVFAVLAIKTRTKTAIFIILTALIYPLGSAAYYLIGVLFDIPAYTAIYNSSSIWNIIASGAPDISDQLRLLSYFTISNDFTFGRTFLGGLVPGNFIWNPSIWTLSVINPGTKLNDVVSGGLRLPVQVWGYVSFGWLGVVIIPFIAGFFYGEFLKLVKRFINQSDFTIIFVYSIFSTFGIVLYGFYSLSIYYIPGIILIIFLLYRLTTQKSYMNLNAKEGAKDVHQR